MSFLRRLAAFLIAAATLSTVFAGAGSAGSHYPLSVVLWNDEANGLSAGQTFTVWAQVHHGDAPSNASTVTFRYGLGVINAIFPAVNHTGVYAGAPGLYRATVTVTLLETIATLSGLAVIVQEGNDIASTTRIVAIAIQLGGPGGGGPWTVTAGVENLFELGATADPGETLRWRIDTYNAGLHANATSLQLNLYEAPDVDFTEVPTPLTPVWWNEGVYMVNTTVPAGLTEGREFVLQAVVDESNYAAVNASLDVWFYDTVVAFSAHNETLIAGELTIGDGATPVGGVDVALELAEDGNPSHVVGWINGTTNGTGKLAFSVPNDGTISLTSRGWLNKTGGNSQFVTGWIRMAPTYSPPTPNPGRFDAVPQQNLSLMAWSGVQDLEFQFFANGTVWSSRSVLAFVSGARGIIAQANLTTDGSGRATLSVDLSAKPASIDDLINQALNFTFRAPTGLDASSSDGQWWGEDEERGLPDPNTGAASILLDTDLSFTTEPLAVGSPFGVGIKYLGTKTGLDRAAAILMPGGIESIFDGLTGNFDVWTGHDQPFINALIGGAPSEYFGPVRVPAYWPNTTYTLLAVAVPSFSILASGDAITMGALNWTQLSPGEFLADFAPSTDTAPPAIFGQGDITTTVGPVDFVSHVYDDSLDFHSVGQVSYDFFDHATGVQLVGETAAYNFTRPGIFTVMLTARDGSGNTAWHVFTVTVLDTTAPAVSAGPDFFALGGSVVNFSATLSDDDVGFPGNATVAWTFAYNGTPVTLSGAAAQFTFWTVGTYTVTLNVTDAAGNWALDTVTVTVTSPDTVTPTVDAGPDRTVDAGAAVDFNGTATDNDLNFPLGATCGWTFSYNGTPEAFSGSNFTFTFWTLGTVDLLHFCLDFWGNLGQDTVTITVDRPDKLAPVADAGPDVTVDAGTAIAFAGSATDNDPAFDSVATYWWLFTYAGAPQNLSGPTPSFTFDEAGDYTVTLFARDGWGNVGSDTMAVHVLVPDTTAPVIVALPDQALSPGTWLNISATVTDGDPTFPSTGNLSWTLTFAGAPVEQSGAAFSFFFGTAGEFVVLFTARDAAGNAASRSLVVRVAVPDTTAPTVTASATPTTVEAGSRVSFAGSAADRGVALLEPRLFNWSFTYNGTPVTLPGASAEFTFAFPGLYLVNLTVRDLAGNVGFANVTVTVTEPAPPPPTTAGGDLTPLLIAALLVVGGAAAYAITRRRGPAEEPKAEKIADAPAKPDKPAPAENGPRTASQPSPEEDKDLDDLLN